eukprot:6181347-Pleurochrysis_carterae.AAC.1
MSITCRCVHVAFNKSEVGNRQDIKHGHVQHSIGRAIGQCIGIHGVVNNCDLWLRHGDWIVYLFGGGGAAAERNG